MTERMPIQLQIDHIITVAALLKHDATGADLARIEEELCDRYPPQDWEAIERAALRMAEGREETR
jgi:hypothetical protein